MKILTLFCLVFFLTPYFGGIMEDFSKQIPREIQGWTASKEDEVFDRKTLYDYMNGGAEVYLAFDFRQVFVRKYNDPDSNQITLDVYDMGSSEEAFGIFSCDREDEPAGIGQDSEYGFGLLRFWQGKYFVTITAMEGDKEAEPVIRKLGIMVARQLNSHGEKPALLSVLPKQNMKPLRTSFFHSNVNLNNRFFIASENILKLTGSTNCVFAEYADEGEDIGYLLVVQYSNDKLAEVAYQSFLESYMAEAEETVVIQTESQSWTLADIHGPFVSVVFEALSRQWALELQSAIKYR